MSRMLEMRADTIIYGIHTIQNKEPNQGVDIVFLGFRHDGIDELFTHIPYDEDAFCFAAHNMMGSPLVKIFVLIDGERHAVDTAQIRQVETSSKVEPIWCPAANMIAERPYGPSGTQIRRGSKHFAPGAKLYCYPALWGDGYGQIQVFGRHRGSHRYVKMIISSSWLINWRAELVYSPHLIRELSSVWDGTTHSHENAQHIADFMNQRVQDREQAQAQESGQ